MSNTIYLKISKNIIDKNVQLLKILNYILRFII